MSTRENIRLIARAPLGSILLSCAIQSRSRKRYTDFGKTGVCIANREITIKQK